MKAAAAWVLCVLAALSSMALAQRAPAQPLPLPELGAGVMLRVAYVHNPRFPALPPEQLQSILALTSKHLKDHMGLQVAFSAPAELPIANAFSALEPRLAQKAESLRLDPTDNPFALDRLARELLKDLRHAGDIAAQKRFASAYLLQPAADAGDPAFARALVETQHTLLRNWHQLKGSDGQPLIGKDRYNEYTYWNLLGSTQLPYEVLVTNQLIASAEWHDNSVHSAVRGGVSNGITSESRAARFKTVSVLSTFPFLDNSPQTVRLRGGDTPTQAEANNYIALLLAHELGHQLLHLGHPFGNAHCVMTPPLVLRFKEWAANLAPEKCRLDSSKANTPGAVKFAGPDQAFK